MVLNCFRFISRKNSSLNCSTVSNSLVRVDGSVELLTVEKVLQKLLNLRNTCRTTNKNNFLDLTLVGLGITERLLYWVECTAEQIGAHLFKPSTSYCSIEINSIQ